MRLTALFEDYQEAADLAEMLRREIVGSDESLWGLNASKVETTTGFPNTARFVVWRGEWARRRSFVNVSVWDDGRILLQDRYAEFLFETDVHDPTSIQAIMKAINDYLRYENPE